MQLLHLATLALFATLATVDAAPHPEPGFMDMFRRRKKDPSTPTKEDPHRRNPASAKPAIISAPVILSSPYEYERVLGRGGFGVVYQGYKKSDKSKTPVAIKCIRPDKLKGDSNVMMEREYKLQKDAASPYVLKALDLFTFQGSTCMVLELAMGGDMEDYFTTRFGLPVPEAKAKPYFLQWAKAIKAMHDKNMAHHDIKPGNVMMTTRGSDSQVRVADFGLSCYSDDRDTIKVRQGTGGTDGYRAPEITMSKREGTKRIPITPKYENTDPRRVDVYALGVAFRKLVTNEDKKHFASTVPGVSDNFANLVTGMMRENPSERYTMDQVVNHRWFK